MGGEEEQRRYSRLLALERAIFSHRRRRSHRRVESIYESPEVELRCAEVDEDPEPHSTGLEVVEELGNVLASEGLGCLQLDDHTVADEQVGFVVADDRAVFVTDGECVPRLHIESFLPEAIHEGVFVDPLEKAGPEVPVRFEGRLADHTRQFLVQEGRLSFLHDADVLYRPFGDFRVFGG
jgi:hypothetical protein